MREDLDDKHLSEELDLADSKWLACAMAECSLSPTAT
jgi:hypothetical protein